MKSALSFLLVARQCEIAELEQLASTSELVGVIGRFTHALQRERGASNVFLASQGRRFGANRVEQIARCDEAEREVRECFDRLDTDASRVRNGARLFSRIAVVLHALDDLPALRTSIEGRTLPTQEATNAFVKLIAGLLAVVFEAADSATDPEISRALVAMFNFMQGKEFAGQERAFGAAVFASGRFDAQSQQQWRHLIESQRACFQVFSDFSAPAVLAADHASQEPAVVSEVERLRRIGSALPADSTLDTNLSQAWFDCCTQRIDAMKTVEDLLAHNLRRLCERKITDANAELRDQQAVLHALSHQFGHQLGAGTTGAPAHYGPQLERSVLGMVQEQSLRIQAMSDELETARASLKERKTVERAKGLLMAHRRLTEEEAYKQLRRMAMNQNRRLVDVAEALLAMADVLPDGNAGTLPAMS
jgi:hypothetical protein